jgi:polyisoprenoid-binding protein YceI
MTERFELDPAHTVIGFSVTHLGVTAVRGRFRRFEGWFEADRADLAHALGEVTVDVSSLTTEEAQRDAHLLSADFFDAEHHGTMTFRLEGVASDVDGAYRVLGNLTIRETTRPIVLKARYRGETPNPFGAGSRIGVSATAQLDRTVFGLLWNQMAGDVPVVALPVDLEIDAEIVAAPLGQTAAAGIDEILERLSPRELEQFQRALDRVNERIRQRLRESNDRPRR